MIENENFDAIVIKRKNIKPSLRYHFDELKIKLEKRQLPKISFPEVHPFAITLGNETVHRVEGEKDHPKYDLLEDFLKSCAPAEREVINNATHFFPMENNEFLILRERKAGAIGKLLEKRLKNIEFKRNISAWFSDLKAPKPYSIKQRSKKEDTTE